MVYGCGERGLQTPWVVVEVMVVVLWWVVCVVRHNLGGGIKMWTDVRLVSYGRDRADPGQAREREREGGRESRLASVPRYSPHLFWVSNSSRSRSSGQQRMSSSSVTTISHHRPGMQTGSVYEDLRPGSGAHYDLPPPNTTLMELSKRPVLDVSNSFQSCHYHLRDVR